MKTSLDGINGMKKHHKYNKNQYCNTQNIAYIIQQKIKSKNFQKITGTNSEKFSVFEGLKIQNHFISVLPNTALWYPKRKNKN